MTDNLFDKKIRDKTNACINCGNMGHDYKHCREPITSWGIILIETTQQKDMAQFPTKDMSNYDNVHLNNLKQFTDVCESMNLINFLLVRRKHSLGFIEFMRGRYDKDNIDGITYLFQQMVPNEIHKIDTMDFKDLWIEFWNNDAKKIAHNTKEYDESYAKFMALKNCDDVELPLEHYTKYVKPLYSLPEWGFPKGRKMRGESDLECATREFCEETGLCASDIKILNNIKPVIETLTGTNGIDYRHIYYVAEKITDSKVSINEKNTNEIGDIGFFSFESANCLLRDYHIGKKTILKNIFIYFLNCSIETQNYENNEQWTIEKDLFW